MQCAIWVWQPPFMGLIRHLWRSGTREIEDWST